MDAVSFGKKKSMRDGWWGYLCNNVNAVLIIETHTLDALNGKC